MMTRRKLTISALAITAAFALRKIYVEYSKKHALELFADPDLFRRTVGTENVVLKDAEFLEERHSNLQIKNTTFINCSFTRCVFLGNEWHNVTFDRCTFLDTMIGENSTLEATIKECAFSATEMNRCYVAGKRGYLNVENCDCKGQKADAVNDAFVGFGSNGPTRVKGGRYYKTAFESTVEVLIENAHLEFVGATTDGDPGSKVSLIKCKGDQIGTGSVEKCLWQDCNFRYSSLNGDIENCLLENTNTCLEASEANIGTFKASNCKFITAGKSLYGDITYAAFFPRKMQNLIIEKSNFVKGDLFLFGIEESLKPNKPKKRQRANVTSITLTQSSFDSIEIDLLNSQSVVIKDIRITNLSITNGLIANWSINNLHIDKTLDTTGTKAEKMQVSGVTKGNDFKTINTNSNVVL